LLQVHCLAAIFLAVIVSMLMFGLWYADCRRYERCPGYYEEVM